MSDVSTYMGHLPVELREAINVEVLGEDPEAAAVTPGGVIAPITTATATTAEFHTYADGTSGDDTNDGLTVGTPKKTLQAVFDVVPEFVKHNTTIHLTGTFVNNEAFLDKSINKLVNFIVDGGSDVTIVDGPHVSDINSISSIGLTTAGWTPDEHAGYFVQILTGPAAGESRLIQGHTATTITPVRKWYVDPGAGAQFQIVHSATTIDGTERVRISTNGTGLCWIQHLHFDTDVRLEPTNANTGYLTHLTFDGESRPNHTDDSFSHSMYSLDPMTYSYVVTTQGGCGVRTTPGYPVSFVGHKYASCYASFYKLGVSFSNCTLSMAFAYGCRSIGLVEVRGSMDSIAEGSGTANFDAGSANYMNCKIDNAGGVGLQIFSSLVSLAAKMEINDCGSHGIDVSNSRVFLKNATSGSGNTGAGVYAHSGSVVHIKDGSPPTLTGTVGEISTDGTTEESKWATIDAATPVADVGEMTLIKEI